MLNSNTGKLNKDQTIFDLTPFPMWIYDLETFRFLKVNNEAIRHYGYSEEEFLHMTLKDIRPKEDIPKLEKAVNEARGRTAHYKESLFRHQKRDGSIMYVRIKSNLILYEGKKAAIVSAIDLTESYKHEQKIEAQKKYLHAIGTINQLLIKTNDWQKPLNACFKIVGETINVDRVYFFQNNPQQQTTSQQVQWTRDGIEPLIDSFNLQNIPYSQVSLFMG